MSQSFLPCLGLLLALAPAASPAEELQPAVRVTIPFGGAGAVATVVGVGMLAYYFMRSLGIAFVESAEETYFGGGTQESDPCEGVAVGEECVGG